MPILKHGNSLSLSDCLLFCSEDRVEGWRLFFREQNSAHYNRQPGAVNDAANSKEPVAWTAHKERYPTSYKEQTQQTHENKVVSASVDKGANKALKRKVSVTVTVTVPCNVL